LVVQWKLQGLKFLAMYLKTFEKYNIPVPRYTSFPAVPHWNSVKFTKHDFVKNIRSTYIEETSLQSVIDLYIHLPFCESLCTYCGCNTRITKNHAVELPYLTALLKEWSLYLEIFETTPIIGELHIGGGTPTFFSPENLAILIQGITSSAQLNEYSKLSFEGHPANTTVEHLQVLYNLGFTRVSFGIQDFSTAVQKIINRAQTFEQVENVTKSARKIGYQSINYDLVYGLPGQTITSLSQTLSAVEQLKPERIAFYSYAHVPWLKPAQKSFPSALIPHAQLKTALYMLGKKGLNEMGYIEVGMDHYALPTDSLINAMNQNTINRNFMGYTTGNAKVMVGLGVSSISDVWYAYAQNTKDLKEYFKLVAQNELAITSGHILNKEDLVIRKHLQNLICRNSTSWYNLGEQTESIHNAISLWKEMEQDGLVELHPFEIKVTALGKGLIRNICSALDPYFNLKQFRNQPQFSSAI